MLLMPSGIQNKSKKLDSIGPLNKTVIAFSFPSVLYLGHFKQIVIIGIIADTRFLRLNDIEHWQELNEFKTSLEENNSQQC